MRKQCYYIGSHFCSAFGEPGYEAMYTVTMKLASVDPVGVSGHYERVESLHSRQRSELWCHLVAACVYTLCIHIIIMLSCLEPLNSP